MPGGLSPFAVPPMNVVIVSKPSAGLTPEFGCSPAAISTIIVSPMPREIPSTIEATIPEIAAGKTTRVETWRFVCAQPEGPLAQTPRHRAHRVLGDRGDRRHDHDAHHQRRPRAR